MTSTSPPWLSTWSHRASRVRGIAGPHLARPQHVAVLRRGAAATATADARPPRRSARRTAARRGRPRRSRCGRRGRPCRAASTAKPISRTAPSWSIRTFSGTSRPWATPASWARASVSATSATIQAATVRRQRPAVGEQDVEAGAGAPLVDHEAAVGGLVDVEHPQHPAVEDGGRGAGGLAEQRGALVVAGDDVHRDVALQHRVEGAPEPPALALGQQVGQSVPVGEHVAGPGVLRHPLPFRLPAAPILGGVGAPANRRMHGVRAPSVTSVSRSARASTRKTPTSTAPSDAPAGRRDQHVRDVVASDRAAPARRPRPRAVETARRDQQPDQEPHQRRRLEPAEPCAQHQVGDRRARRRTTTA